ncbi:hypothetical protein ACS0TY_033517 [Phlomoides rotata]
MEPTHPNDERNAQLNNIELITTRTIARDNARLKAFMNTIPSQMKNMSDMSEVSDEACRDQLRMDRAAFHKMDQFGNTIGQDADRVNRVVCVHRSWLKF